MLVSMLRKGLGNVIVFLDWISRPAKMKRTPEDQARVDAEAQQLSLYQFHACPFCVKTRRTLHRLYVSVALKDAKGNPEYRQELEQEGGKIQVPCLRINENGKTTWMYESKQIDQYLSERFGA